MRIGMVSKNNIAFIGFMGTGKTTIGRNVAKELDYTFVDTDLYIEEKLNMSISEYFKKNGENQFREKENYFLKEILSSNRQVISTGGGIILLKENRELLKNKSFVVTLKASGKTIYYRTKRSDKRPLLKTQKPLNTINKLMNSRRGLYDFGDLILRTDDRYIEELVKEVVINYEHYIDK